MDACETIGQTLLRVKAVVTKRELKSNGLVDNYRRN